MNYDQEADILTIKFSPALIEESDEIEPGIIVDYDADGHVVGVEILDISKRIERKDSMNKRYVIVYQTRDIWVVMCPSLPVQSEFGRTEQEALDKMKARIHWFMKDVPGAPPDIIDPKIVSINAP